MTSSSSQAVLDWIKTYTELLIDELHPQGDVLEIGFGIGQAAHQIQSYHPKSHTIIEFDPKIAEDAKAWGSHLSNVKIIQGNWQSVLPNLGTFDEIFFNDVSKDSVMQLMLRQNPQDSSQVSINAKEIFKQLEEQFAQITVSFSDQELDDFYQQVGKFNVNELPSFLSKLKEKKHISEQQYENAIKKYGIREETQKSTEIKQTPSQMLIFLEECLEKHMRKGSRFSCFLADTTSKYEDALFFDHIITNTNVDFHEKSINIQIPNCKLEKAQVILVEKN